MPVASGQQCIPHRDCPAVRGTTHASGKWSTVHPARDCPALTLCSGYRWTTHAGWRSVSGPLMPDGEVCQSYPAYGMLWILLGQWYPPPHTQCDMPTDCSCQRQGRRRCIPHSAPLKVCALTFSVLFNPLGCRSCGLLVLCNGPLMPVGDVCQYPPPSHNVICQRTAHARWRSTSTVHPEVLCSTCGEHLDHVVLRSCSPLVICQWTTYAIGRVWRQCIPHCCSPAPFCRVPADVRASSCRTRVGTGPAARCRATRSKQCAGATCFHKGLFAETG